ncbi:hypothetical protein [Dyadobacter sp. LHD-138]|uniref:hypothetical protein n=1 Tax=Dyadobacter sp. LHD-138 TaxID=3071413 RepID=UPI0027E1014E|nr:hypothetical protein [Dyadobacter sp. LHD-138]MDQ6478977.1 hypothetical protein [Dyadobacter sp. LHD-138]
MENSLLNKSNYGFKAWLQSVILVLLAITSGLAQSCDCPSAPRNHSYSRSFINAQKSLSKHSIEVATNFKALIPLDIPIPIEGSGKYQEDEAINTEHNEAEAIQIIDRELDQFPAQIMAEASAFLCQIACNSENVNGGQTYQAWHAIDAYTKICERVLSLTALGGRSVNNFNYTVNNVSNYIPVEPNCKAGLKKANVTIINNLGNNKFLSDLDPGIRGRKYFKLKKQVRILRYKVDIPANVTQPIERRLVLYPKNNRNNQTEVKFIIFPNYGPYPETDFGELNPNSFIDPKSVGGYPSSNQLFYPLTWSDQGPKRSIYASKGTEQYYHDGVTPRAKANSEIFFTKRQDNNSIVHTIEFSNRLASELLVQNDYELLASLAPIYKTTIYVSPNTTWEGHISFQPAFNSRVSIDPKGVQNFTITLSQATKQVTTVSFSREGQNFIFSQSKPISLEGGSQGNRYTLTIQCPSMQILRDHGVLGSLLDVYGNAVFTFNYKQKEPKRCQ